MLFIFDKKTLEKIKECPNNYMQYLCTDGIECVWQSTNYDPQKNILTITDLVALNIQYERFPKDMFILLGTQIFRVYEILQIYHRIKQQNTRLSWWEHNDNTIFSTADFFVKHIFNIQTEYSLISTE